MAVGRVPARAPGTSPGDGEGEGHTHAALTSGETLDRVDRVSLADLTTGSSVHLAREKAVSGGILSPHCDNLTCYIRIFFSSLRIADHFSHCQSGTSPLLFNLFRSSFSKVFPLSLS